MKHYNETATVSLTEGKKGKGKESVILLIIGLVGAVGLIYLLNASSGKSAFSANGVPTSQELVYQQ
jgi:hypothetical protein